MLAATAWAQEISYSTSVGIDSTYVFRGFKLGEETFMGSFDVSYDDFYAGIWTAQPTTDEVNWDSEIDFYGGYSSAINDVISFDVGGTYYYYPTTTDASTFEIFGGLSWDVVFAPAVYAYYDFDLETFTFEASAGNSWDVADKTTFDLGGSIGWIEPDAGDSQYYIMASGGFSYSFTEYATGSFALNVSELEGGTSELWVGAHTSVSF